MAKHPIQQLPVGPCPCDDDDLKNTIDTELWPAYNEHGPEWMNEAFLVNANNERDIGQRLTTSHYCYYIGKVLVKLNIKSMTQFWDLVNSSSHARIVGENNAVTASVSAFIGLGTNASNPGVVIKVNNALNMKWIRNFLQPEPDLKTGPPASAFSFGGIAGTFGSGTTASASSSYLSPKMSASKKSSGKSSLHKKSSSSVKKRYKQMSSPKRSDKWARGARFGSAHKYASSVSGGLNLNNKFDDAVMEQGEEEEVEEAKEEEEDLTIPFASAPDVEAEVLPDTISALSFGDSEKVEKFKTSDTIIKETPLPDFVKTFEGSSMHTKEMCKMAESVPQYFQVIYEKGKSKIESVQKNLDEQVRIRENCKAFSQKKATLAASERDGVASILDRKVKSRYKKAQTNKDNLKIALEEDIKQLTAKYEADLKQEDIDAKEFEDKASANAERYKEECQVLAENYEKEVTDYEKEEAESLGMVKALLVVAWFACQIMEECVTDGFGPTTGTANFNMNTLTEEIQPLMKNRKYDAVLQYKPNLGEL